ncbi:UDP-N-acetylglucosamine 1-carboxyvinyltransferase [Mageeibacillus indolicus]|uniref:UDP-N-acetylglucosamine 1-carboxyvinyltransferase n=1 Tax=Mageeibacillus indolicus TaxID=884684 RepID=A0A2J8B5J1_9FIRM|nr:UDP-N-acetylglucosamine 1-carboxyvinyltransferase [Mageeibacillus indolicus]PNH20006.1 UDP-N-acetylglucosamine 1-carboxyvinyltransferase [Mageeibacillus indolicus]
MNNTETYVVTGGTRLHGTVAVSGSKNAALGIVAAAMLLDGPCHIENVPDIADIKVLLDICKGLGAGVSFNAGALELDPTTINSFEAVNEKTRSIRASYYLQGALLGRFGKVIMSFPGGCDFGTRPIDLHKKGFEAMGAKVTIDDGIFAIEGGSSLRGGSIFFDQVSVGATINLMIAAAKLKGTTTIENAAREPHIVDVANFLNTMGANIKGAGTDTIRIVGVPVLPGNNTYSIIPDQIEAGTFMLAAAMTRGDVIVTNLIPRHMDPLTAKLVEMGIGIEIGESSIRVYSDRRRHINPAVFKTMPYPGFPTDLQPQTVALLCLAEGQSKMYETIWDNRFQYIDELKKMGANITISGKVALISGPAKLTGACVRARDLRAGAAMVLAGLIAQGKTEIYDIHVIQRGYENFVQKLMKLGAKIEHRPAE